MPRDRETAPLEIFATHSKEDEEGKQFLEAICAAVGVRLNWYPFTTGRGFPHSKAIAEAIERSASLVFMLHKEMELKPHTRSWVAFEAGIARGLGRRIWVIERFDTEVNIPVPGAYAYLQRLSRFTTARTFPFYTIFESAGMRYPRIDRESPWLLLTCLSDDCRETFLGNILDEVHARCPTCRKPGLRAANFDEAVRFEELTRRLEAQTKASLDNQPGSIIRRRPR